MGSPKKDSLGFFLGGGLLGIVDPVDLESQGSRYLGLDPLANLLALHSRALHHFIEKVHDILQLWNIVVALPLLLGPFLQSQQRSLLEQQGLGRLRWRLSVLLLLTEIRHDLLNFPVADTSKTGESFQEVPG